MCVHRTHSQHTCTVAMEIEPMTCLLNDMSPHREPICVFKCNVCMRPCTNFERPRVCVTGFISLLQICGGGASHPIICPVSRRREREATGEAHLISLNGDRVECMRVCVWLPVCVYMCMSIYVSGRKKETDLCETAIVQS